MGRGKVQLKQIQDKTSRQVTFSKRKNGLRKKAHEISVLCDAQVALILFNANGKLYEFSSESSLENILERYEGHARTVQVVGADKESQENSSSECFKLNGKIKVLERNIRNLKGHDLDPLNLRELQNLENQLDTAIRRIRARKNVVMNESISEMQKETKTIQEQNNVLAKKIKENEKTVAEPPPCWPEKFGQNSSTFNSCPPERQSPQELDPSLSLGL